MVVKYLINLKVFVMYLFYFKFEFCIWFISVDIFLELFVKFNYYNICLYLYVYFINDKVFVLIYIRYGNKCICL